jgi:hypothetical protein
VDMRPRHVGGRYPTPGFNGEGFSAVPASPLHAHNRAERVHHNHQGRAVLCMKASSSGLITF